jgi:predicted O-methyltransferase YrrM
MLGRIQAGMRDLRRMVDLAATQAGRRTHLVTIRWEKKRTGTWLANAIPGAEIQIPFAPDFLKIERLADRTQSLGRLGLWEGYGQPGATRDSTAVRCPVTMGNFYCWLTRLRRPAVVVELGTAFGISGMYWLSGLKAERHGRLLTFEPNARWAEIATRNLSAIDSRFVLTVGTFEDNAQAGIKDQAIDIAFIDAIHKSEFVLPQFWLIQERLRRPGLVLFDDIGFSEDMKSCWESLAAHPGVVSALSVNQRLGVVEVG